jgi:hypothetical protein
VGLFSRKDESTSSPRQRTDLQPPDEYGQQAQVAYGSQQFHRAFDLYCNAIDKLHTMYVMGDCRYRQPSSGDVYILEGFVSATGAAKAVDPNLSIGNDVERSVNYLNQIVEVARQRGADAGPFMKAAEAAAYELRH